ncbi:MAG: alpha-amylase family glycosyl hydrolase [Myxococcota bacterium]
MIHRPTSPPPHHRQGGILGTAIAAVLVALVLAACSGDTSQEEDNTGGGFIDPNATDTNTTPADTRAPDSGMMPDDDTAPAPNDTAQDDTSPDDTATADTAEADTAADTTTPAEGWPETWTPRACEVVLRYRDANAVQVSVAGSFNGWDTAATPMPSVDTGLFEVRLTEADGLVPGQAYPYKLVLGGSTWILDPDNTHQKYEGDCINSAFVFPSCGQPNIAVEPFEATWNNGVGRARIEGQIQANAVGSPVATVTWTLDGTPLPEEAVAWSDGGGFTVTLEGLAEGRHVLAVRAEDAEGERADPVDAVFWVEEEPFDWRDTVLYMLFIDRFANGNTDNDDPVSGPVERPADWHGGDLEGALEVMRTGYFEELGVRAIWLSPINAQVEGHFGERSGGGKRIAAYHGYWPIDAREVEPRFGGNDALKALVDEAHRRGIRVLLDLINNQVHEDHAYVAQHPDWFRTECICGIDPGCGWSERPLDCRWRSSRHV